MSLKKFKRMSKHEEERIIISHDLLNFIKFSLFLIEKRSCFIDRYLIGLFVDIFCDFIGLVEEKILIFDCSWELFFFQKYMDRRCFRNDFIMVSKDVCEQVMFEMKISKRYI